MAGSSVSVTDPVSGLAANVTSRGLQVDLEAGLDRLEVVLLRIESAINQLNAALRR